MSIVSRLFPPAELEALRGSTEGFTDSPPRKRRKTDTSNDHPFRNKRLSSTHSGYSSGEQSPSPSSATSSPTTVDAPPPPHSALARSYPPSTSSLNHALVLKYLSSMHPLDRARYYAWCCANHRRPVLPSLNSPHHLRSDLSQTFIPPLSFPQRRKPAAPSTSTSHSGRGWTAGPRAAATSAISTRVFDGLRLTGGELSMLDSLLPGSGSSAQVVEESAAPRVYEGFAIGVCDGDDDEEGGEERGPAEVEDFFDLDEASGETGAD